MMFKVDNQRLIKVWKNANEEQKNKIFYYSLFDFKSFEEDWVRVEISNKIRTIQNSLNKIISNIDKRFFTKIKKSKFTQFAGNDNLLKSILINELKHEKINAKSCGNNFPDILIYNEINLEIKRLVSTKNMGEDIWGVNIKDCENLLLLLFFPSFEDDNPMRIEELTNGYYFIKNELGKKRKSNVLICIPTENNFREVLEKIINCIKNPNWCENEQ